MNPENRFAAVPEKTFAETLDNACTRLAEKQARYSIKHLDELDAVLCELEADLNALIREAAVRKGS